MRNCGFLLTIIGFVIFVPARSFGGACVPTTFAGLEASGSCTLGDLTFSLFSLGNFSGTAIAASQIDVTPLSSDPLGFTFTIPQVSGGNALGFLVSDTNGVATLDGLEVAPSALFSGFAENVCVGAGNTFIGPNGIASCSNTANTIQLTSSGSTAFSLVSALDVSNGIVTNGGSSNVTLTERFSESAATPEPGTLGLLSLALLCMVGGRAKRALTERYN
jgi:hypothetical protein